MLSLTFKHKMVMIIQCSNAMERIPDRMFENQCVNSLKNLHFNQKLDPSFVIMLTESELDLGIRTSPDMYKVQNKSNLALRRVAGCRGLQP